MLQVKNLLGSPIVLCQNGQSFGTVLNLQFKQTKLSHLICFDDEQTYLVPAKNILTFGSDVVLLKNNTEIETLDETPTQRLLGRKVYDINGSFFGTVEDILIKPDTLSIFVFVADGKSIPPDKLQNINGDTLVIKGKQKLPALQKEKNKEKPDIQVSASILPMKPVISLPRFGEALPQPFTAPPQKPQTVLAQPLQKLVGLPLQNDLYNQEGTKVKSALQPLTQDDLPLLLQTQNRK